MPFDPEDVLGAAGQTDPGKGQKPSSGFDPLDVKAAIGYSTDRNLIGGTIDPNTQFNDFRFQPKTNADNYLLRAQDQGFWESLGRTAGNVVANIPLDIIQGVGYLGTLFEVGDDRDYSNELTKAIDQLKSPFGEVYQERPEQSWDMSDSAWWLNNLGGLAETAASFAAEGAGIAKLFGTLAKGAAWSTRAAKLGAKAAQGLSAATLTYMEGAMSGAHVFEKAYNTNYMKMIQQGIDPVEADQQAKHTASQAAATTVQLHTIMNLGLNLTALAPIFRDTDQAIVQWWRQNGAALPGEDAAAWAARISQAVPEGTGLKKLLGLGMQGPGRLGLESLQEGLEEVNTQYAERVGEAIGQQRDTKNISKQLFDLDRYFSEVLNEEGALNMALGSLGGIAQTVLLDRVPVHKVLKYGPDGQPLEIDGKLQTERISSHTMNNRLNRQYFDNIRDALTKDMEWFSAKNKELQTALEKGDLATVARTKADLLSVHNLRAISMGLGDVWKNQYQEIMNLDNTKSLSEDLNPAIAELDRQIQEDRGAGDMDAANQKQIQRYNLLKQQNDLQDITEAMQKGFAQNKSDNSYREKAQQAIQNLDYLTELYNEMQSKFSLPEMKQAGLADHMFYRQANLYLQKQQLDSMDQDMLKLRSKIDSMLLTKEDDLMLQQAKQFLLDKEVMDDTIKKLNNDIKRLSTAVTNKDNKTVLQLLDKYKIPATEGAGNKLTATIERRKEDLLKRSLSSNKELDDTLSVWKSMNPEGDIKDLMKRASEKTILEDVYKQNRQYYQQAVTEYEIGREQLAEDSTEKNIQKFLKENNTTSTTKDKQYHIEAYARQADKEIAEQLDAKQKQVMTAQLDNRISELQTQVKKDQREINTLRNLLQKTSGFRNLIKRAGIRRQIQEKEAVIKEAEFEINQLLDRKNILSQPSVTQPQPQPKTTTANSVTVAPEEEEELPEFDFAQDIIQFTTLQEGHNIFDTMVGGHEAGNILRQFIQIRKDSTPEFLVNAVKTMIKKNNLEVPSDVDVKNFLTPYVTALKEFYTNQKPTPEQSYESLKGFLKPIVLTVLDMLETEFKQHGFSYDRTIQILNQQVKEGNLEKNMVGPIANTLKDYMDSLKTDPAVETEEAEPEVSTESPVQKEMNEEPTTYIPPTPDSEPTVFSNAALDMDIVRQEQKRFVGASNIEAVKANFNTHPYKEFEVGNEVRTISDYTELDPNLNTDVLIPGRINQGDDIVFVVDEQWSGEINYDTEMMQDEFGDQLRRADMFQNYLDATGKIDTTSTGRHPKGGHANVPIKIVHKKTGKTIGYFPRADWILKKYPNTENFANVVDEYQDEDIVVTGNVARQYGRIIKLREAIVRAWNRDKSLQLTSTVAKRGTGHVMINREVNPNTGRTKLLNRSAKNMLPDPSLEIAIVKDGTAYVSSGIVSQKPIRKIPGFMKDATSMPVAMLPSPDGSYVPTPLYTHKLGDNPSTVNTIVSVIEIHMRYGTGITGDEKTIQKILEATDFDIREAIGLRNFINQYFTYTDTFGEKDTVITPSEGIQNLKPGQKLRVKTMLDIPDVYPGQSISEIKIGTTFSGERPVYAQLVNGRLHPDFEQELRNYMGDRFRNVIFPGNGLRGVNSQGEFKVPIIRKDGTVQVSTFLNYNEYVKSISNTFVYGLNQADGQYVYMANPVIQLDYTQALQSAPPAPSTTLREPTGPPPTTQQEDIEEYDDLADLFGNGMLSPSASSVTPMVTPNEGEQVSLEFLQELRNLTPEAHRNTKTPEQVLRELLERGITVLAPGHNPFYLC